MVPLPFERAEYDERLRRVRERMAAAGLDLLVVTDVANQHYLTGYDGWSFYTPQVAIVPIEDEAPHWVGRAMDAAGGRLTAWLPPDRIVGWPEDHVHQTDRHPMDWIAAWLRGKDLGRRRIGVETDTYYYSPKAHARLVAGLPDATFLDGGLIVNWVRAVKSPILAGANASAPHMLWTERRFTAREAAALELAGACRHYTAGLARTMQLGKPEPALLDTAKAVGEGMEAALGAVRPGTTGSDVEAAWRAVLARHGLKKESRIGYSIGLGYPPDWGEHTISLRAGDRSVLEPGNTLHIILGMWMAGWGYELSETVLVTERGRECLTEFPRELFVKP
jgi:Xaa-Pro dipeptidase